MKNWILFEFFLNYRSWAIFNMSCILQFLHIMKGLPEGEDGRDEGTPMT